MLTENRHKILMIIFSPKLSGAEIAMLRLVQIIEKDEVLVVCGNENLDVVSNFISKEKIKIIHAIKHLNSKTINLFKLFYRSLYIVILLNYTMLKLLKKNKFDVIYVNNVPLATYLLPSVFVNKIFNIQKNFYWHEHTLIIKNKFLKLLEKVNYLAYDKTIVSSNAVKKNFFENKTYLLKYGIPISKFKSNEKYRRNLRKSLGISNEICIGIFGVISPNKGHHLLIEVFKKLVKIHPNIKLLIIGKAYDKKYEKLIKNIADHNIIFLNWVNNIQNYYNAIDILINASDSEHSEAFGLTIIEAMANKKIVLCSNTGGIPEIVKENINGFLFNPNNKEELFTKLNYIINNFLVLDNIRTNAEKTVIEKYDIKIMLRNFENLLNNENP